MHRLFAEYASGKSPRLIAADLMRDKVPSPTGSAFWNYQTIVSGAGKKRGLINNPLYVGVYLKNRTYNVKNPSTGKTITREANPDDLIRAEVPHLRIIDQKLWDAAHKVRAGRRNTMLGKVSQRAVVPRKQHLLANLLRCSECNGRMVINSSDRHSKKGVCCSAAHTKQSCSHRKTNNLDKISALAVEKLCERLSDPELLKERARARVAEAARLEKESNGARQAAQKQLDRLAVQIAKLVRLVEQDESDEIPAELVASLKEKQIERRGLEERIRLLGAETNVTALHPTAAKSFGRSIEKLREMIERNPDDPACRMALGNVLDSIIVHPTEYGKPYEVSLYARLSAVMGGVDLFSAADEKTPAKQGHSRVLSQADARPCPNCHAISKPKRWQRALKIGTSLAANYAKTRKDWAQPGVPMVLGSRREVEGRAPW